MTETYIDQDVETSLDEGNNDLVTLYAHAHTIEKYWVLTKNKSTFIKGTRLLYKVGCNPSKGPTKFQVQHEPTVGDIGIDITGKLWKIKTLEWV